jgi:hypothetical protein
MSVRFFAEACKYWPWGFTSVVVERVIAGRCVLDVHEAHCWVLRQHGGVVSGVVFENCRVDASIFVVKLLRAHGGCLGFRSR